MLRTTGYEGMGQKRKRILLSDGESYSSGWVMVVTSRIEDVH